MTSLLYRSSRLASGAFHRLPVGPQTLGLKSPGHSMFDSKCVGRRLLTSTPKQPSKEKITQEVKPGAENVSGFSGVFQRFIGPKEMPPRWTTAWYGEMVLICTVFAITGTSTMIMVRPAVSYGLGLQGSLKDGPWSYRICSIVIMTPIYSTLLVLVGTAFGRHHYFRHFSVKMFSRFGIPPEMLDANFHQTQKHFRKY